MTDRIAITGIGLVTSLGMSAAGSMAAVRGGLANFVEHETVLVVENESGTDLCGATIARLPEEAVGRHVHGADRAVALLAPAIAECTAGVAPGDLATATWRVLSALPPYQGVIEGLLKCNVIPGPPTAEDGHHPTGRCLFFKSIIEAVTDLCKGTASMAVVCCVDSLCDDPVLTDWADSDRLKSAAHRDGIIAGEAAGAVLLEKESHAIARGAGALGYFCAWGTGVEPDPRSGAAAVAKGLRGAFEQALSSLPEKGDEIDLVIADLNGERCRSEEWAVTAPRVFPSQGKARELMHPADCTGDCGAAMGAILLAAAIDAMPRASAPKAIALSASDADGARCVLCLRSPDRPGPPGLTRNGHPAQGAPFPAVLRQHCEEASFLWALRQNACGEPDVDQRELERLDARIKAHLEGLLTAGNAGWEAARCALSGGDAGEVFTAAFLAFKCGDRGRIAFVSEAAGDNFQRQEAIFSALHRLTHHMRGTASERFSSPTHSQRKAPPSHSPHEPTNPMVIPSIGGWLFGANH